MAQNKDLSPANGLQGDSYIYDVGTTPNTRAAVSQKVRILTPAYGETKARHQMGVVSSLGIDQSRNIENIRGIGFGDQIAELVPGVTEPVSLNFERTLLYLANLWQAVGYAAGVDGPVRSLAHHRWPFDTELQLVFSSLSDLDLGLANQGKNGESGKFDGGVKAIAYPQVTPSQSSNPDASHRGHTAVITIFEACWFQSFGVQFSKDQAIVMETGTAMASDVHDFATAYGEFLATGNDPTIGQLGSMRFAGNLFNVAQSGSSIAGGGTQSTFLNANA